LFPTCILVAFRGLKGEARVMTKKAENRLAAVMALRVPQEVKKMLIEEAVAEGQNLSDYLFDLLNAGRKVRQAKARELGPNDPKDIR
jgi:hypothetical protein